MNVLILTPDRVGSTLLQRVLTVYANINEQEDPLTINLHELTNGIVSYHNEALQRQVLGKRDRDPEGGPGWGYHQSLETVTNLLKNCNHDVTARLAHYHIRARQDALSDQLAFYDYLNKNFHIIATRRRNLFEHAMSWSIVAETKTLNVFDFNQKHEVFKNIHEHGITVQKEVLEKYLGQYNEYMDWVDRHFHVSSYFEYERDMPDLERFVLEQNSFKNIQQPQTWHDRFGLDWNTWNRMHYLLSLVPFDYTFSNDEKDYIKNNIDLYTQARVFIQQLQNRGIMTSGIPIKLHTLKQKAELIKNIDQCLLNYNNWVGQQRPSYAITYQAETLNQAAQIEHSEWKSSESGTLLTYQDIAQAKTALPDLRFKATAVADQLSKD
jgi:hypothetical protein